MVSIDYRQGKVLGVAALCAFGVAVFLWILVDPAAARHARWGRVMSSGFGHAVILPLLILACASGVIKMLMIAVGPGKALEFADDAMIVHTGWSPKRVAWSEFAGAEVKSYRAGWSTQHQLVIRRNRGGKLKISLGLTNVSARPEAAIEVIELMQTRAFALGHRVSPALEADLGGPVAAPVEREAESGFDADAALARYLEKKKRGIIEAPGPAPAMRQGFGRKGL